MPSDILDYGEYTFPRPSLLGFATLPGHEPEAEARRMDFAPRIHCKGDWCALDHIEITDAYRDGLRCLRLIRNAGPEGLERFGEFLKSNSELIRIKDDPVLAAGTNDMVVALEPTERLRELMAATRAWENERHTDK